MSDANDDGTLKREVASLYTELDARLRSTASARHTRFMNFGYRALDGETPFSIELPPMLPNRDSASLLLAVIEGADLNGQEVVEVGCGRGGNLWTISRFFEVARATGVDITHTSVAHALHDGGRRSIRYINGDAEQLPVRTASTDAVINIESSCHYPNIEHFYREVSRITRPGGRFLYADLLPTAIIERFTTIFAQLGFATDRVRDISENVSASRAARGARQTAALGTGDDRLVDREWTGAQGSLIYDAIRGSELQYFCAAFTRTDALPEEVAVLTDSERELIRAGSTFGAQLLDFEREVQPAPTVASDG